jgi:tetratricopeptide (TPR) repeat protein
MEISEGRGGFLAMQTHRGKGIALSLVALVALGGCANVQQKWNMLKSRRAFKQANQAYANKSYQEAIDLYNETLALDPNPDPRVLVTTHFYRGSSSHLLYRPSKFDDPENDAKLEAAITDYEKAIELSQQHTDEYEMLKPYQQYGMEQLAAIYRDNLDDFENAEKYFKSLIEYDPKTPERYYALADVYERFHDPEELPLLEQAIESYKKPVEISPSDPLAYRQVANLLNKYGRFDETMEWLGKARDVKATDPEGYYLIAVHYWDKVYRDPDLTNDDKKEYIQLGMTELDRALEIQDDYVDALIYKNLLLREQAKIEPNARLKAELTAQADELRDRALALRQQQQEAAKAAATTPEGEAKEEAQPPTEPPSSH